ncbi:hypothetical protein NDN08_005150 [Rhodosorus marinus]|uniref:Uncharacterized protein n=1 Tax=Rhodosorus marinus TaxID=101924 RepID=A0AAV8V4Z8_9RHOD|nr:hypothetical protein NDN08_005150 [Rhodosorus marinus]
MEPELSVLRKKQIGKSDVADQLRKFLRGKDGTENDTDLSRNISKLLAALEAEDDETTPTAVCSDELAWQDPKVPANEQSIRESGNVDREKTDDDLEDDNEDQAEKSSGKGRTKPKKKGSKLEKLKGSDKEGTGTKTALESKPSAKLQVDGVENVAKRESKKNTPSKKKKRSEDSMKKKKKEKRTPKKDTDKEAKLKRRKSSSLKDGDDTSKKTKRKSM